MHNFTLRFEQLSEVLGLRVIADNKKFKDFIFNSVEEFQGFLAKYLPWGDEEAQIDLYEDIINGK